MKTVGIIGGLGPASTVEYYQKIIEKYKELSKSDDYPNINIISINMTEVLQYVQNKEYVQLVELLSLSIRKLENTSVDFALIASNTPHVVFDQIAKKTKLKLISIVESTCENIKSSGFKKALLTGTLFTMKEDFYSTIAMKYGIKIIIPTNEDIVKIHNIIFPELENGIILPGKKVEYIDIVEEYIKKENIECVILGCTELPLLIQEKDISVPIINTLEIHVNKIVNELLS